MDEPAMEAKMEKITKNRAMAAAKVAAGAARIVGGVATAAGHGVLGSYLKSHQMTHAAVRLGKIGFDGGLKTLKEGLEDWKRS